MKRFMFLFIVIILLVGCNSTTSLSKSNDELKKDIIGETIGVVTLSDENLKEVIPVKESIEKDRGMVIVNVNIEHLIPHSGSLNTDMKKNDVLHIIEGEVTLNYMKTKKGWVYNGISDYKQINYKKEEIENLMERIDFSKTSDEVLQDLRDTNIGIKVVNDYVHTITFGQNDILGYKPIIDVTEFEIISTKTLETNELLTEVKTNIDINYKVENSIFDDNGIYNIKGTMDIIYKLEYNENQEEEWKVYQVKDIHIE